MRVRARVDGGVRAENVLLTGRSGPTARPRPKHSANVEAPMVDARNARHHNSLAVPQTAPQTATLEYASGVAMASGRYHVRDQSLSDVDQVLTTAAQWDYIRSVVVVGSGSVLQRRCRADAQRIGRRTWPV